MAYFLSDVDLKNSNFYKECVSSLVRLSSLYFPVFEIQLLVAYHTQRAKNLTNSVIWSQVLAWCLLSAKTYVKEQNINNDISKDGFINHH